MRSEEERSRGGFGTGGGKGDGPRDPGNGGKKVALEEKYFRRMDKFEGDAAKYRSWMFDLGVAIGGIDEELASELERLSRLEDGDKWNPGEDLDMRDEMYRKYKGELYGLLCSLTQGEAKTLVKGVVDAGHGNDGFRAFISLNHRCD